MADNLDQVVMRDGSVISSEVYERESRERELQWRFLAGIGVGAILAFAVCLMLGLAYMFISHTK